mmetsp:Transcript_76186/g.202296  ORF Transcript_76186/g.202296 Transcript_76186/m.202296 type:complete len:207 (+) Transcript_76186:739-1359(+)
MPRTLPASRPRAAQQRRAPPAVEASRAPGAPPAPDPGAPAARGPPPPRLPPPRGATRPPRAGPLQSGTAPARPRPPRPPAQRQGQRRPCPARRAGRRGGPLSRARPGPSRRPRAPWPPRSASWLRQLPRPRRQRKRPRQPPPGPRSAARVVWRRLLRQRAGRSRRARCTSPRSVSRPGEQPQAAPSTPVPSAAPRATADRRPRSPR